MNIEVKSGGDNSNSNYNEWANMVQDPVKTYNELNDEEIANIDAYAAKDEQREKLVKTYNELNDEEIANTDAYAAKEEREKLVKTYNELNDEEIANINAYESVNTSTIETKIEEIDKKLKEDLNTYSYLVRMGSISEEEARNLQNKAKAEAKAAKSELLSTTTPPEVSSSETKPEIINEGEAFAKFQVVSGVSKEAEFKRLTGEDWPGENYYATCYGVDEGYDEPIENWTIYKRVTNEQSTENDITPESDTTSGEDDPIEIDYVMASEDDNTPEGDSKPEDDTTTEGEETNQEDSQNKVDLGGDALKNIKISIDESKAERLKEVEGELEKMLPKLAELYAKNRRIFVGAKNRADFIKIKGEYNKLLDESIKLKSEAEYNKGMSELSGKLQERVDELNKQIQEELLEFVGNDLENTNKTQDEVNEEKDRLAKKYEEVLQAEYGDMIKELETKVNANFLSDYLKEASKLEDATIDALDNGTICRQFVNKVINNKYVKTALVAAAVAGLAATGVGLGMGLAAGTMSVSLGYTAGGVALGASKGALMGGLMSRQNSKNSAVRGFVNEEELKAQLEGIKDQDADTSNVTSWLLEQYSSAKDQDLSSNRKRTALSAGIGAALGGFMSGVHINNIESHPTTETVRTGTEPDRIEPDLFNNVDVARGGGMYDSFTQMGGNPDDLQKALDIAHSVDAKYSMVPGSNSITTGFNGQVGEFAHTYPGPISEWPDVAQGYMREVAEEWARQGLIPSHTIAGGPIYDTITTTATKYVPNAFLNFITRATATVGAGAIGGAIGGAGTERSRTAGESVESAEPVAQPQPERITPEDSTEDGTAVEFETTQKQQPDTEDISAEAEPAISSADLIEKAYAAEREHRARAIATALEFAKKEQESRSNPTITEKIAAAEREHQARVLATALELAKQEQRARQEAAGNETEDVESFIIKEFSDKVGEKGIRIMTSKDGASHDNDRIIEEWWKELNDNVKDEVLRYELELGNSTYGQALRVWLRENIVPEQR